MQHSSSSNVLRVSHFLANSTSKMIRYVKNQEIKALEICSVQHSKSNEMQSTNNYSRMTLDI